MIKKIYIKNFAIVDHLEIDFSDGFQVLTGETGAGKSIIVGAISLLCGERGQSDLVKDENSKAVLEMEIEVADRNKDIDGILKNAGVEDFGTSIIIRREINSKGVSRAFLNDSPVALGDINAITSQLIDLHGQHQHQKILYPENHVEYLDLFADNEQLLEQYQIHYFQYLNLQKELNKFIQKEKENRAKKDLYEFQFHEIRKCQITENELLGLKNERKILENSEFLYSATALIGQLLYENEESVSTTLSRVIEKIEDVAEIDPVFKDYLDSLRSVNIAVEDAGQFAETYKNNLEFDPERLEQIRTRETEIEWLIKKYNLANENELIKLAVELEQNLNEIENFDKFIAEKSTKLKNVKRQLSILAQELSNKRKEFSAKFEDAVKNSLKALGMQHPQFKVQIENESRGDGIVTIDNASLKADQTGIDKVQFIFSANAGEPMKPLHKIASGGEISRTVIAIKSLIAETDKLPCLIFDEIDTGVSGKIAQTVGHELKKLSINHQLIVITHLPQIAAQAKDHYVVLKNQNETKVNVEIKKLDFNERILEMAKLLGGAKIGEEALANARALLQESKF